MHAESHKLPPSERDFEVYQTVVVDGESTRAAAAEYGVSKTRIIQIRDKVIAWIADELPPNDLTTEQKVRVARHLAQERMFALYSESMTAWRKSQGRKTVERTGERGTTTVTREEQGNTKYLQQALRVTIAQAKLWVGEEGRRNGTEVNEGNEGRKEKKEVRKEKVKVEEEEGPIFSTPFVCPPAGYCPVLKPGEERPCNVCPELPVARLDAARTSGNSAARRAEFLGGLADEFAPVQSGADGNS